MLDPPWEKFEGLRADALRLVSDAEKMDLEKFDADETRRWIDDQTELARKAYDALPEGGALVVIENIIDDARRENAFGLLMSLNMLIEFGDAFDFSEADFRSWCTDVGFTRFDRLPLLGPASAVVAYK